MSSSSMPSRLRRWLGPAATAPGSTTLLGVGLVDSSGTGLYLAGSAVYFSVVVGLGPAEVGLGLSLAGLLGLVAAPMLGWCADRWSARRVLVLLHLWRAAAFALLAVADDVVLFVVAAAMIGVGQQALSPIYQALVEDVVGTEARVAVMARTRVVYNVGFSLGGVLATLLIGIGTHVAFVSMVLGNALCCLVATLLLARAPVPARTGDGTAATSRSPLHLQSLRDGPCLALAALNGALTLHISILAVGIPLWVTLHTSAPRSLVGILLVVNTVLAVLLQVRASKDVDSVRGGLRALRGGGGALVCCCLLLSVAPHLTMTPAVVALLLLAVLALTGAELLQSAGGWGLSYALAPTSGRTEFLSTFNLGTSAQFVLGPTIVTIGAVDNGTAGWLVLAACLAVVTASLGPAVRAAAARVPDRGAVR